MVQCTILTGVQLVCKFNYLFLKVIVLVEIITDIFLYLFLQSFLVRCHEHFRRRNVIFHM